MRQCNAGLRIAPYARAIGTTIGDGVGHRFCTRFQLAAVNRQTIIDQTCDTAHNFNAAWSYAQRQVIHAKSNSKKSRLESLGRYPVLLQCTLHYLAKCRGHILNLVFGRNRGISPWLPICRMPSVGRSVSARRSADATCSGSRGSATGAPRRANNLAEVPGGTMPRTGTRAPR